MKGYKMTDNEFLIKCDEMMREKERFYLSNLIASHIGTAMCYGYSGFGVRELNFLITYENGIYTIGCDDGFMVECADSDSAISALKSYILGGI